MRRYITEFIGTFGLVLTVGCVVLTESNLAPLAIGGVLVALVFAGGHISGAHYNPAVTVAVFLRGRLRGVDVLPYFGAQIAGGLLGGVTARLIVSLTRLRHCPSPVWTSPSHSAGVPLHIPARICGTQRRDQPGS